MVSPQTAKTLRVSDAALQTEASWCESMAAKLAGNTATGVLSSPLASAAAVATVNAQVATAGANCTTRMQATAAKLAGPIQWTEYHPPSEITWGLVSDSRQSLIAPRAVDVFG